MPPFFDPSPPFRPSAYRCKVAATPWERRAYHDLRREVFCGEQGLFQGSDHDEIDTHATPIVAVSMLGVAAGEVVGCVRIDEREPGEWFGSRLAVTPGFRGAAPLAANLIRKAVCTAHARGCRRFWAYVQRPNVRLFQRLNWHRRGPIAIQGHPHELMEADLTHYPARAHDLPIEVLTGRGAA
ncbi:MAG: MSMEG_0567/Sll0786 family nitrogen starvation N-acetyltransferase [Planctomycetota bacterium]